MAHRSRRGFSGGLLFRIAAILSLAAAQAEELEPVPSRSGDRSRDGAQRSVVLVVESESISENLDHDGLSLPLPAQHGSRQREPRLLRRPIPVSSYRVDRPIRY